MGRVRGTLHAFTAMGVHLILDTDSRSFRTVDSLSFGTVDTIKDVKLRSMRRWQLICAMDRDTLLFSASAGGPYGQFCLAVYDLLSREYSEPMMYTIPGDDHGKTDELSFCFDAKSGSVLVFDPWHSGLIYIAGVRKHSLKVSRVQCPMSASKK